MLRVLMLPTLSHTDSPGGINRVIEGWHKYARDYDIEYVSAEASSYDLLTSHAGSAHAQTGEWPDLAATHGLYWANDYAVSKAMLEINARVIQEARHAKAITVPSRWVAKTFQREMRLSPYVVPHGIDWKLWQHNEHCERYILWNKNRPTDACDPGVITDLALTYPEQQFVTTFASDDAPNNVHIIGTRPHNQMRLLVQKAGVYLSTARETFCIGALEAMASGVPVLGWDFGGNAELITHGVTGYFARDPDDLADGLLYCLDHRERLGANAREAARAYTWQATCEQVASIYRAILTPDPPTAGIIIPCYNYGDKVSRAVESAMAQTYPMLTDIIVVDDGSPDDGKTERAVAELTAKDARVRYIRQPNSGVAYARGRGVAELKTKYVCCLDADDAMETTLLERCIPALEKDPSLGIVYTGLRWVHPSGVTRIGSWPKEFDYEGQLRGNNGVPTCNVARRELWERLGGQRQRYSPLGCGAEDAEMWLRAGAYGWDIKQATNEPLFIYSMGTGYTSRPEYEEVDWLAWHPWVDDGLHPMASIARPKNRISHLVRQYDSPFISVIIPVGPGHQKHVIEALDSLEAQTLREWEVIIVDDTGGSNDCPNCPEYWLEPLKRAYPYITTFSTPGKMGAGYARNRGAELATASLLLFLDADDFLKPDCLSLMLEAWNESQSIVYTDYEAHRYGVEPDAIRRYQQEGKLLHNDGDYAVYTGRSAEYDWRRVQVQPENPPYIWNLITSLVPRAWHDEIGGFDELAPSWEDWDYWVRLSFAGKPFIRLPEPLIVYLYHTGSRRETGYTIGGNLLQYYSEKFKEIEKMPCTGCGQRRPVYQPSRKVAANPRPAPNDSWLKQVEQQALRTSANPNQARIQTQDVDWIKCRYTHPNRGEHMVYGVALFELPVTGLRMIQDGDTGLYAIDYGMHGGGDVFLVHVSDIEAGRYFQPVEERLGVPMQEVISAPVQRRELPPEPEPEQPKPPKPPSEMEQDIARVLAEVEQETKVEEDEELDEDDDKSPIIIPTRDEETELRRRRGASRTRTMENKPAVWAALQLIPGISTSLASSLYDAGYHTPDDLLAASQADLETVRGIGPTRAELLHETIQAWASRA